MKRVNLIFLALLLCISVHSQINVKVELNGNFAIGKMADYFVGGPGADINVKYLIENKLGIGITAGFQHFFAKDWEGGYDDIGMDIIPIRGLLSYYFGENSVRPYLGGELGLNLTTIKYTYDYYDNYGGYSSLIYYNYSHTRFGAALVAGLQFDLTSNLALDLNAKLNLISKVSDEAPEQSASYIGFNFGLVYKFVENK
jgi:opacity protein-like surface antigen